MGALEHAATQPAQIVRAPAGSVYWFRLAVPNAATPLVSLLPGSALPVVPSPYSSGQPRIMVFKGVVLISETDPAVTGVRYTDDGQSVPSATLGGWVPGFPNQIRIMADPQDIQLFSTSGTTNVQCCLIVAATTPDGSTN